MSLTVLEQIGAAIATRLAGVQGATIVRPKQIGKLSVTENKTIWVIQGDAFKNEEHSCEGNPYLQAWDQEFSLDLFIREAESDSTPIDTRVNDLYGKVIATLTEPSRWETWGGLAIKTTFDSQIDFSQFQGVFNGRELTLTVTYRHRETDPYNAG